jgi:hypothetical protein
MADKPPRNKPTPAKPAPAASADPTSPAQPEPPVLPIEGELDPDFAKDNRPEPAAPGEPEVPPAGTPESERRPVAKGGGNMIRRNIDRLKS